MYTLPVQTKDEHDNLKRIGDKLIIKRCEQR